MKALLLCDFSALAGLIIINVGLISQTDGIARK